MSQTFDVVVIGAGPAGYIAAVRCAQLGMNTACVEGWTNAAGKMVLGGTCLNVGCIPSKALLQSSENFEAVSHKFVTHGISVTGARMDIDKMLARKDAIVSKMTGGIEYLFKKNKITWLKGYGKFAGKADGWQIEVSSGGKSETVTARNVIVATGSKARHLPGVPVDNQVICDNEGALYFKDVPQRLGIIGAGVIGLELGSVWRRLGAEVTVLEALPAFLGAVDEQVAKEAQKVFTKQGLTIHTGVKVGRITAKKNVTVEYTDSAGAAQTLVVDKLIVSIGRVPNTQGLNGNAVGLKLDERGFIAVDGDCKTNLGNVWAVGDVVRGPMLAHKAEEEGVAVAERIAGKHGHVDFNTVPWVIYTSPEIAWVGKTEQQLKQEGVKYRAGSFPFMANGRARALGDTTGFVKFLADERTDRILGVHIIGPMASELIAEAVVAMEFGASSEDIAMICHAHPSLSEAMKEAALAVDNRTLNL